jgi:hypothetical protein
VRQINMIAGVLERNATSPHSTTARSCEPVWRHETRRHDRDPECTSIPVPNAPFATIVSRRPRIRA